MEGQSGIGDTVPLRWAHGAWLLRSRCRLSLDTDAHRGRPRCSPRCRSPLPEASPVPLSARQTERTAPVPAFGAVQRGRIQTDALPTGDLTSLAASLGIPTATLKP